MSGFSVLTDVRRGDKRSSICVSGKIKNPPMTTVRIDALGLTHVPSVADTSQITELTSCPQNFTELLGKSFFFKIKRYIINTFNVWSRNNPIWRNIAKH